MPILPINIPDALYQRTLTGMCGQYSYPTQIADPANQGLLIPNPQSKADFVKSIVIDFIQKSVLAYEKNLRDEKSKQTAAADAATLLLS